jgi:hypothetical protein
MSLVVLSVLGGISIVMAWAWVLIVLGHVFSSDSDILHVVAEGAMLIVVLARSICDLYLFRWRLRMDGSRLNLCFGMLVAFVVLSWARVLIVLCLIFTSNSNIFHVMSELSMIVVILSWRWVLLLM